MEDLEGPQDTEDSGKFNWKQDDQREAQEPRKNSCQNRANAGAKEAPVHCNNGTEWAKVKGTRCVLGLRKRILAQKLQKRFNEITSQVYYWLRKATKVYQRGKKTQRIKEPTREYTVPYYGIQFVIWDLRLQTKVSPLGLVANLEQQRDKEPNAFIKVNR